MLIKWDRRIMLLGAASIVSAVLWLASDVYQAAVRQGSLPSRMHISDGPMLEFDYDLDDPKQPMVTKRIPLNSTPLVLLVLGACLCGAGLCLHSHEA